MKNANSDSHSVIKAVKQEENAVVLYLGGEIDMKTSAEVKSKLHELFKDKPKVLVVDMTDVGFMDSSGLATLVGALKWCRTNGSELRLAGLTRGVRSVFEVCRLEKIFQIYENLSEALSK